MFGDAMSIFARSTQAPSSKSPRFIASNSLQIFFDRAVAIRAVLAGLRQRAAVLADVVGVLMIDVREPALDELDGAVVDVLEVVRRVAQPIAPVEPEPAHVALDALDELFGLALGVRVVEPQIARAAELLRDAEIDADGFRVADVQVAVRLGREARLHAPAVLAGRNLVRDDLTDEVAAARGSVVSSGSMARALSFNRAAKLNSLARREAGDPLLQQGDAGGVDDVRRERRHAVRSRAGSCARRARSSPRCPAR